MLQITEHIKNKSFPCIMAKILRKGGLLKIVELDTNTSSEKNAQIVMMNITPFLAEHREKTHRLSSFILTFKESKLSFSDFEAYFWALLASLRLLDNDLFEYDTRVSSNPIDPNYSFSIQEEAFFILMLHPNSPRLARQTTPSIVFNPHQQFEKLRTSGNYNRVRNMIRKRDINLQGNINPTLRDFGEDSEILQYSGTKYNAVKEITQCIKGGFK